MRHGLLLSLAMLAATLTTSAGCIIPESSDPRDLPTVKFDVYANPPDCLNASEMERDFNRVVCEWNCVHHKGADGRRVVITFEPLGDYVDQEIRSWHVSKESVDEAYSHQCPDWFDEDGYSEYEDGILF